MHQLTLQQKMNAIGISMGIHHVFLAAYNEAINGDSEVGFAMVRNIFDYFNEECAVLKEYGIQVEEQARIAKDEVLSGIYTLAINCNGYDVTHLIEEVNKLLEEVG